MTQGLSREVEIDPHHAALLIIDVQNYTARRDGGEYRGLNEAQIEERFGFFFRTLEATALPDLQRLQAACRNGGIEVIYTVIESLTEDGRDRSLDYKISGLHVPKGCGTRRCSTRLRRPKTRSSSRRPRPRRSSRPTSTTCCAISRCDR